MINISILIWCFISVVYVAQNGGYNSEAGTGQLCSGYFMKKRVKKGLKLEKGIIFDLFVHFGFRNEKLRFIKYTLQQNTTL